MSLRDCTTVKHTASTDPIKMLKTDSSGQPRLGSLFVCSSLSWEHSISVIICYKHIIGKSGSGAGGEGATAREVLRHKSVQEVVMVDIDKVPVITRIMHTASLPMCLAVPYSTPPAAMVLTAAAATAAMPMLQFWLLLYFCLCTSLKLKQVVSLLTKHSIISAQCNYFAL